MTTPVVWPKPSKSPSPSWVGQIVGKETYTATDTDFSAILTKVADSKAEVLYLPDYYNIVNLVGAQAKDKGITSVMMGGDGWDSADLDVKAAEGGFYSNHYDPGDTRPIVQDWLKRTARPTKMTRASQKFRMPWRPWLTTRPTCSSQPSRKLAPMIPTKVAEALAAISGKASLARSPSTRSTTRSKLLP